MLDENHDHAIFNEVSSCPASLQASKIADALGLVEGYTMQQADAVQAYIQARLTGIKTWIRLPRFMWPKAWEGMVDPVCPLIMGLYGHPEAGACWEDHCENKLTEIGFEPIPNWRSCFWLPEYKALLIVYVDDFKLAAPTEHIKDIWDRI